MENHKLYNLDNDNLLPFRFKELSSGKFFLSNDYGDWVILKADDFQKLIEGKQLDENIVDNLKEQNLIQPNDIEKNKMIKQLAGRWLLRYKYLLKGPSLHIMVLTQECNHVCRYCHASAKPSSDGKYHMTKDIARQCVDIIFQTTSGDITIEFQGGEPIENWNVLKYVVEYAREKNQKYNLNLKFALVSNLTLLNKEKIDFLISDDINISTSIDGPKAVHDKNRPYLGNGSGFEKTVEMLKKINKIYNEKNMNKQVGSIVTVTKDLLGKEKELVDTYVDELELEKIFVRPLSPYGMAEDAWGQIGYSDKEYMSFYKKVLDYIDKLQKQDINIEDTYRDSICKGNLNSVSRLNYMEERSPCGAVLGQLAYNWDGKIYTCDEARMLAATNDNSFQIAKVDGRKKASTIYKEIITNNVTKIMVHSSIIDAIPGYETHPYSSFIGVCPIYSYKQSDNVISKYKNEERFREQEMTFDKITS